MATRDSRPDEHTPKRRRSRADGELSRVRILDAATEIAAERGYEGTSIALVSAKCGLPASSIYWHFKDKDDLIAAVIERSFGAWLSAWQIPEKGQQDHEDHDRPEGRQVDVDDDAPFWDEAEAQRVRAGGGEQRGGEEHSSWASGCLA